MVSWGTREVAKKKTKAELEEEKRAAEEAAKAVKKQKKEGRLMGFLMQKAEGRKDKGGMEFSLANLFKCMCFTHEDTEDPSKQLVKVAASLDDITTRLARMESKL